MPINNNTRNIQAAHLYATRTNANTINVLFWKKCLYVRFRVWI